MIAIQTDEHIPEEVVTGFARGIEAYSAYHEGLSRASDREVSEYAQRKNRIILTNDPDFFPLLEEGQHHGILYLTTQRAPIGRIIRDIARLVDTSRPEEFENNVFYVPQGPWAISSLLRTELESKPPRPSGWSINRVLVSRPAA